MISDGSENTTLDLDFDCTTSANQVRPINSSDWRKFHRQEKKNGFEANAFV